MSNDKGAIELLDSGVLYAVKSISINDGHNILTITFEDGDKLVVYPDGDEDLVVKVEPLYRGGYII